MNPDHFGIGVSPEEATRVEAEITARLNADAEALPVPERIASVDWSKDKQLEQVAIGNGTILHAKDGVRYVVSNLKKIRFKDTPKGQEVGVLTLRRLIPKVRGKAARRADKAARRALRKTNSVDCGKNAPPMT